MKTVLSTLLFATAVTTASAAPATYDFQDPKGVNTARFTLDAPLEAIAGTGNGITGTVTFDPAKPAALAGSLTYLPGKLADRTGGQLQGDLIVLRAAFSIKRSDFGLMPGQMADKVAETIELSLALAGHHAN